MEKLSTGTICGCVCRFSEIGSQIKKLLEDKGINLIGTPFTCKGKA